MQRQASSSCFIKLFLLHLLFLGNLFADPMPIVDYHMDECIWNGTSGEVEDSSGNTYHATAIAGAVITTGKLYRGGEVNTDDKALLADIPLPASYALTVWINFPLNEDDHVQFGTRRSSIYYFNIADLPGSNYDYIYFTKNDDRWGNSDWSLCVTGENSNCKSYNPQSLSGWHQLVFNVSNSGTDYYVDGTLQLNFDTIPNEGSLGLIMNSDYDSSTDNASNGQSLGADVDEFKIFSNVLTSSEISTIYNNENAGKNYDGTERIAIDCNGCTGAAEYAVNLVKGGTAENSSDLGEWITESGSNFDRADYSTGWAGAAPSDAGSYFFFGDNGSTTVYQIIDLCNLASDIDANLVDFNLSAYHGGYGDGDTIEIEVIFRDENGDEISSVSTGAYTSNQQMDYFEKTDAVPVNTRSVSIKLILNKQSGTDADGYSDNISFILSKNTGGDGGSDTNSKFNVWDTFRNIDDRNISTKIVSQEFNLFVASLNETNDNYQEFNGTVCSCLNTENCFKNLFRDVNNSEQTDEGNPTFSTSSATKEMIIDIHWKKNIDTNCPLINEDNSTNASDSFAIRPKRFLFTLEKDQLYAGEIFQIDFNATDNNDVNSLDYNETKGTSFELNATILKEGCNIGTLNIADFSFSDGSVSNVDANYTNIGDLNISIKEKDSCSDKYASVDCDDKEVTNYWVVDQNLSIEPFSQIVTIQPYELNITQVRIDASTNTNWLYMANVNDMNLSLFAIVQANNKQHQKLNDFNSTCYAKDVNVSFGQDVFNGDDNLEMNATVIVNDNTIKSSFVLQDINRTITISKDYFIAGEGNVSYFLNVDRNYSDPVNPFEIKDFNITILTENVAKNENSASDNNSSFIFYFARVTTDDKETTKIDVTHFSETEVYDNGSSDYVVNFKQNSLNWYANAKHDDTFISLLEIDGTKKSTLNSSEILIQITSFTTNSSKVDFNISNSNEGIYRMHTKIKPWFWYFPARLGQSYNDSDGSDCTEHPCFEYILKSTSSPSGVISGDFTGSDFNTSSRGHYERTGVKVFR